MGVLSDYKSKNPEVFKTTTTSQTSQNSQRKENLPIKVTGYEIGGSLDTNFILGIRIDTKEPVKVRLEEIEQNPSSKYKRVEVKELSDAGNKKRYVPVGCPMVFEGAKQGPDGNFYARWGVVLDRDPNGTNVMVMNSCLKSGSTEKDGQRNEWFNIQALMPVQPKIVSTKEDFDTLVAKQLTPRFNGSNPQTFVRITDDTGDVHVIEIKPLRIEVEEEGSKYKRVISDGSLSLNDFIEKNKEQYDMIISFIDVEDVKIELIPSSVLYPGAATKEKMNEMHKSTKQLLVESFHIKDENENSESDDNNVEKTSKFTKFGFLPCILATRIYADGTPYLTYIRPVAFFENAISIEKIEKVTVK